MDKSVKMSMLLDLYGNLLTNTQKDTAFLYFDQNLSLSEIAEELNITRQGVRKNLSLAEEKLLDLEEKLGFLEQKLHFNKEIEEIMGSVKDKNLKERLQKLL